MRLKFAGFWPDLVTTEISNPSKPRRDATRIWIGFLIEIPLGLNSTVTGEVLPPACSLKAVNFRKQVTPTALLSARQRPARVGMPAISGGTGCLSSTLTVSADRPTRPVAASTSGAQTFA